MVTVMNAVDTHETVGQRAIEGMTGYGARLDYQNWQLALIVSVINVQSHNVKIEESLE